MRLNFVDVTDKEKAFRDYLEKNKNNVSKEQVEEWEHRKYKVNPILVESFFSIVYKFVKIQIVGDYDTDGEMAACIMKKGLSEITGVDIDVIMPDRFTEGYGISESLCKRIRSHADIDTLIITVDNGTNNAETINKLVSEGYHVIITDHHLLSDGKEIPNADLVINPKLDICKEYFDYDGYCGAGVAYKLVEDKVSSELKSELRDYVGIATMTDCMPLTEENHVFVKDAVAAFRNGTAPSNLRRLINTNQCKTATEKTFSYSIGPILNAPGRIESFGAEMVVEYLLMRSKKGVGDVRERIIEINKNRKTVSKEYEKRAMEYVEKNHLEDAWPICVYLPDCPEGIVGIIAGRITENYHRPSLVFTDSSEPGILKGSGRSVGSWNMHSFMMEHRENYVNCGGHSYAVGAAIKKESFQKVANIQIPKAVYEEYICGDNEAIIRIQAKDIPLFQEILEDYRPFGNGNPEPKFEVEVQREYYDKKLLLFRMKDHIKYVPLNMDSFEIVDFNHEPYELENPEMYRIKGTLSEIYDSEKKAVLSALIMEAAYDVSEMEYELEDEYEEFDLAA